MCEVPGKDAIEMKIVPLILKTKLGFPPTVPRIINAVLYKLKTDVQWGQLPVKALFKQLPLIYKAVYYYRKWCLSDALKHRWITFLKNRKKGLDLSGGDLDGSIPAIGGVADVEYPGRKDLEALYLNDRQGLPLVLSEPMAGDQNGLYN